MIKNLLRAFFLFGIILLLISSFSLLVGHAGFAQKMVTYAYGLLAVGTLLYILELLKK